MNKIKIYTNNLKGTVNNTEYTWVGGFGAILQSQEKNIPVGHIRMIGNVIFYACNVHKNFGTIVSWIPQEEITVEWIREFKSKFFDCAV